MSIGNNLVLDGKIKKELDGLIEICSDLIQDYEAKLQQILTEFPEREETNMILARSKWLIVFKILNLL